MPMGAPLHEPPATKSGRAGCALYYRPRSGQQLDHPVEEASDESTKVGGEGSVGGGKPVSAWRCGARRRRRSKPEGEASREGSERGGREEGAEDRNEGTTEVIGEQRALYTRAKRRGGANPDGAGLNRKGQRTGTETTEQIRHSLPKTPHST
jgi:hypothetical protein